MITQGIWISEPSMASSQFVRDILPSGECSVIARVGGQGQVTDIDNARLIAAAPDLLEACKDALHLITNHAEGHHRAFVECENIIQSAIAAAEPN